MIGNTIRRFSMRGESKNQRIHSFSGRLIASCSRFRTLDWCFAVAVASVLALLFCYSVIRIIAYQITQKQSQFGAEILQHSSEVEAKITNDLRTLDDMNYSTCNASNLMKMRETFFKAKYVKDIGFSIGNTLFCTALQGRLKPPVTGRNEPTYIKPNGLRIWPKFKVNVFDKPYMMTIYRWQRYSIIYDASLINEFVPENFSWQITHEFNNKVHYLAGDYYVKSDDEVLDNDAPQRFSPHSPISRSNGWSWWSLLRYYVPTFKACNPNNFQCVKLHISDLHSSSDNAHLHTDYAISFWFSMVLTGIVFFVSLFAVLCAIKYRRSNIFRVLKAFKENSFFCLYQPIVHLKTGKIVGVEVLARLEHNGTLITPDEFIPVINKLGLSWEFTKCIVEKSLLEIEQIESIDKDFKVAFNIFPCDIGNGAIANFTSLKGVANSKAEIVIEVIENEFLDAAEAQNNLADLRALGISIAVDDFGTGYSNMKQLGKLDFDILKIDRSFVSEIGDSRVRAPLLEHMVSIAKSGDMKIVAEGGETQEQLNELLNLGVEKGQGWLFGKPMSINSVEILLQNSDKSKA